MFAIWLYHSGSKKKENLQLSRVSSHDLAVTLAKMRLFSTREMLAKNICRWCPMNRLAWWPAKPLSIAESTSSCSSDLSFAMSPSPGKKDCRQERQRKSFWWILGSGRYQDALPQLCAPGFLEGAQGGRGGPLCWVLCSALSTHPSSALAEHWSMALKKFLQSVFTRF